MNCALDALSFLAPRTVEHMVSIDPPGLVSLVRTLAHLGATARWIYRFLPMMTPEADPRTCSPYPFAHLMPGARQQLRTAYATLLKERVARTAPPVLLPPPRVTDLGNAASPLIPIEAGCLICGIGSQEVSAAAVAREGREQVFAKQLRALGLPLEVGQRSMLDGAGSWPPRT